MFWKKCRQTYQHVTAEDDDIQKYFKIMTDIQGEGYSGAVGFVQDMGHKFVSKYTVTGRTLEIGFGRGRQALFFKGNDDDYYPTDINESYQNPAIWNRFRHAKIADASCLPFKDHYFDQVVSIYNLEHVEKLVQVLMEAKRVLKSTGRLVVALPCEDGLAWNLGRELTTRRIYGKQFNINYDKVIAFEHKRCLRELLPLLDKYFRCILSRYYPFVIPSKDINLVYCGLYSPR